MSIWRRVGWVALVMSLAATARAEVDLPPKCYLFTSFRGNGEDGLHLAYSTDGLKWTALAGDHSFLAPKVGPDKLMRDPCIVQGPDGIFHMVWTSGWWDHVIGYASSKDLIHWSEQKAIPVMEHEQAARNSWAPEIVYDDAKQQFLIFWATTIPGRFKEGEDAGDVASGTVLNHRIYSTTTKDFQTFTPTKVFFNPGFSVIDATMVRHGGKFWLVFKDETLKPVKKHLQTAVADNIEGPFTDLSAAFTPDWVEGPTVLKAGDSYICYFDMYRAHKYGAMQSRDLKTWEDITSKISLPNGMRHGTALEVSREIVAALLNAKPTTNP
ncbi:MAG TPA: glycoside hydrolase family 43 protein [Tepidisphaeraceae bacterium]|nr:glycoside hydrolase family 43 protein [Tepidisphaeraceae bacterium]